MEKNCHQLDMTALELIRMGFKQTIENDKVIYEIPSVNSRFYFNPTEEKYRWYYQTNISGQSNHVHLDIKDTTDLMRLLGIFKVGTYNQKL